MADDDKIEYLKIEPDPAYPVFDWVAWRAGADAELKAALAKPNSGAELAEAWPLVFDEIERAGRTAEAAMEATLKQLEGEFNHMVDRLKTATAALDMTTSALLQATHLGLQGYARLASELIKPGHGTIEARLRDAVKADEAIARLQALREGSPPTGRMSDGFHTFDELYDHRITLFLALCRQCDVADYSRKFRSRVWRSRLHSDGSSLPGWFIMGIGKEPGEQITYHLPDARWSEADFLDAESTLERAPTFDGHTSADVLKRIRMYL